MQIKRAKKKNSTQINYVYLLVNKADQNKIEPLFS